MKGEWLQDSGDGPSKPEIMQMFHITRHSLDPRLASATTFHKVYDFKICVDFFKFSYKICFLHLQSS